MQLASGHEQPYDGSIKLPQLLAEFRASAALCPAELARAAIRLEHVPPPHERCGLPPGMCAVYIFSLTNAYGSQCPAGPRRVLKVGVVGPKSDARFRSQHYGPGRSVSNLARSLVDGSKHWPHLGIERLTDRNVETWIRSNTCRDHVFLPAACAPHSRLLESFLIGRLSPLFEGRAK